LFEEVVFGDKPKAFDPDTIHRWGERPTFQECLAEVTALQKKLPIDPKRPIGLIKKLFFAIKDHLSKEKREQLLFRSSIGTTFDYEFGIDGFFVLESSLWNPVTFDISLRGRKTTRLKADWVVTLRDLTRSKNLNRLGRAMAERLEAPARRRGTRRRLRKKARFQRRRFR
jgi:hypothetical protein